MPDTVTQPRLSMDIHVRIAPDTLSSLQLLAAKGNRPLSREVRQALEEYVARENRKRND